MLAKAPLEVELALEKLKMVSETIKGRCKKPTPEVANKITITSKPKRARDIADIDWRTIPAAHLIREVLDLVRSEPALNSSRMWTKPLDDVCHL